MAMGRQRSMPPQPPPLHNFTLPRGLEWGKRKFSDGKIPAVHRRSNGSLPEKSIGRRRTEAASPWQSLGSDERGLGIGALHDGQAERGREVRSEGEDGIAAVRKKLLLDLQAATAKMKEEIIRMGLRDEDPKPTAGAGEERPPAPTTSPATIAPAGPSEIPRPRNLRTRRSRIKHPKGFAADSGKPNPDSKTETISPIVPSISAAAGVFARGEKLERAKFSIALTRQQIEEDLAAITGHKPARRPKKRSKIIQKNLDSLFPGLWLTEISADMYKVRDDR
ncbi:hypothetical protein DM860_013218 [Cuscuta australis]|uniref:DUF1639 domain-containing protein n=1 Tax=Cuscuta australis TaxID=267555 RepID=A0A328DT87_9ASTE|nr:hypothetical protein DM860_013218 [Cuscuta australis]